MPGGNQKLARGNRRKCEALWDTYRGAMDKEKHAFKRPPLRITLKRLLLDAVSL